MVSRRKEWLEVSGGWPLLIWEKPAICWAPGDPSTHPHNRISGDRNAVCGLLFAWHSKEGRLGP